MSETKSTLPQAGLTWFELSTLDMARATAFYTAVLAEPMVDVSHDEPMFMFPARGGVTGALVHRPGRTPSVHGAMVYLRLAGTLRAAMERVVPAGGSLVTGALTAPGVAGTFCIVADTEGNHVGIHAEA